MSAINSLAPSANGFGTGAKQFGIPSTEILSNVHHCMGPGLKLYLGPPLMFFLFSEVVSL